MSAHDEQRLYAGGERRQLWARDSSLPPDAPLVRIRPGEAELLRPLCKQSRLICPFPGCESPELNTAGGPVRRDHFRHVQRSVQLEHHPETYFHVVGKAAVAEWLRGQGADVEIRIESRLPNNQRPDVLAAFPDGRRVAFEVQYAPLEIETWQRRHDGYRSQGITDFWFWGHTSTHLRRAYGEDGARGFYRLSAVQQQLERNRIRVYWLDPDELALATRLIEAGADTWRRDIGQLAWSALSECRIDGYEIASPAEDAEREAAAALEQQGKPTRWQRLVDDAERQERVRAEELRRQEEMARRAELRKQEPRAIDLPGTRASPPRAPKPPSAQPQGGLAPIARFSDPSRRREAIEAALAPHVGVTLPTPAVLALLRTDGISVADFVGEAERLRRDGVIAFSRFSLTGGRITVKGRGPF
jgi:hypothetical protein